MLIADSRIHIWQNGRMSAHHRQIPTYAVIHPPGSLDWLGGKRPAAA